MPAVEEKASTHDSPLLYRQETGAPAFEWVESLGGSKPNELHQCSCLSPLTSLSISYIFSLHMLDFCVWPGVPASGFFFCLCLRSIKFHFNPVPALLASLLVEPPPVSFWAWPQVRKCADSLQQCLFRLVPCGLRRREAVTAMERHIKTPEPDLRTFPAYSPGRYAARRSTASSLDTDRAYRIARTKVQE